MTFIRFLLKLFAIVLVGLTLLLAACYFLIGTQAASSAIASLIEKSAEANGIQLKLSDFRLNGSGTASASEVSAYFRRALMSLKASDVVVSIEPQALLKRNLKGAVQGILYGGRLQGGGNYAIFENRAEFKVNLHDLHLNQHEQLAGLGISAGVLNLTISASQADQGGGAQSHLKLEIKGLERPYESTLPFTAGGGNRLVIPKFNLGYALLDAVLEGDKFSVAGGEVVSTLGTADISGSGTLGSGESPSLDFTVKARLSADGQAHFGPHLPALSRGTLSADSDCFSCVLRGKVGEIRPNCMALSGAACDN